MKQTRLQVLGRRRRPLQASLHCKSSTADGMSHYASLCSPRATSTILKLRRNEVAKQLPLENQLGPQPQDIRSKTPDLARDPHSVRVQEHSAQHQAWVTVSPSRSITKIPYSPLYRHERSASNAHIARYWPLKLPSVSSCRHHHAPRTCVSNRKHSSSISLRLQFLAT